MTYQPTRCLFSASAMLALSALVVAILATSAHAVTIPTVPVGNAGNAGEVQSQGTFGGVAYNYRIGTTEVTNAQYAAFLNAKAASDPLSLYYTGMGDSTFPTLGGITRSGAIGSYSYATITGRGDMPVIFVTWYDAIRFANWLHNGQGSGDTETGAYSLGALDAVGEPINPASITRNAGATWFLTSENEWYKAAYHKNDGVTSNYFDYPTSSDTAPTAEAPAGGSNSANYAGAVSDLTNVGAYTASDSPYGTFDQGGNLREWNESLISGSGPSDLRRGLRGGSWNLSSVGLLASSQNFGDPRNSFNIVGFRVATVPEPSTPVLAIVGCVLVLWWRRRRK